jgi:hypothetical protein
MNTGWRVIYTEALAIKTVYVKRCWKLSGELPPQQSGIQGSEVSGQMTDNRKKRKEVGISRLQIYSRSGVRVIGHILTQKTQT